MIVIASQLVCSIIPPQDAIVKWCPSLVAIRRVARVRLGGELVAEREGDGRQATVKRLLDEESMMMRGDACCVWATTRLGGETPESAEKANGRLGDGRLDFS